MRSVERGICPIATSVMKKTVPMAGCIAHARKGRISTSGENCDVTIPSCSSTPISYTTRKFWKFGLI